MRLKHGLLGTATALVGIAAASPAMASGIYLSFFGGLNDLKNPRGLSGSGSIVATGQGSWTGNPCPGICGGGGTSTNFFGPIAGTVSTNFAATFDSKLGFVVGAAVGHEFFDGLRGELELSYRHNSINGKVDALAATGAGTGNLLTTFTNNTGNTGPCGANCAQNVVGTVGGTSQVSTLKGDIHTWALMANAWYDIDMDSRFKPYLGGGVGWSRSTFTLNELGPGNRTRFQDGQFAWQLGAGVNLQLSDKGSIGLGYRYFDGGTIDGQIDVLSGPVLFDADVKSQSLLLNMTFGLP